MINRIRYVGHRTDGQVQFLEIDIQDAFERGTNFTNNGYAMRLSVIDTLKFFMHKYCPNLNVKMKIEDELTINKLYKMCPSILLDLLESRGGIDFLARIVIGCEELYNQEQIIIKWQEEKQQRLNPFL